MKRAARYALPLAAISAAGFDEPADAADLFLSIDGVTGESTIPGHEGEIDVLAWSWGVATGVSGSAPTLNDIKIIKGFDKASPSLLLGALTGAPHQFAKLSVNVDDGQGGLLEYLKISLDNVIVSKVGEGGKQGEAPAETVTLNFSKITVEYLSDPVKGGTWDQVCWDVAQQKGC